MAAEGRVPVSVRRWAPVEQLAAFSRRQWRMAGWSYLAALLVMGVAGETLPGASVGRIVPVRWWNYVTLILSPPLIALIAATFVPPGQPRSSRRWGKTGTGVGGGAGTLAMACPVCNPLAIPIAGAGHRQGASDPADARAGLAPATGASRLAGRDEGRGNQRDQRRRQDQRDVVPPPDGHDAAYRGTRQRLARDSHDQQGGQIAPARHPPLPPRECRQLFDGRPSPDAHRHAPLSCHHCLRLDVLWI